MLFMNDITAVAPKQSVFLHLHLTNKHLIVGVRELRFFFSSLDADSPEKPIGQQDNLIFMRCLHWPFIVECVCRGRSMRKIKVRMFQGGLLLLTKAFGLS